MSNVMQYLLGMSDEFRQSYEEILVLMQEIKDKQDLIDGRLQEVEFRLNQNNK